MARNANVLHRETLTLNDRIAMAITRWVGSMPCAYLFAVWALIGLKDVHTLLELVQWVSQTFLQLVLLSIIMVGQDLQGRHTEIRAELDFEVNQKAEKQIEDLMTRLAQVQEIVEKQRVEAILSELGALREQVAALKAA